MKKLFVFLSFLIPFFCSAQVKQLYPQYGGTWKRLETTIGLRLANSPNSTKDGNNPAFDSGQIYYDPSDSTLKYHTGFQWLTAATGNGLPVGGDYYHYITGLGTIQTIKQGTKNTGSLSTSGLSTVSFYSHSWEQMGAGIQYSSLVCDTLGLTRDSHSSPGSGLYGQNVRQWVHNVYNPARTNLIVNLCLEVEALAFNNTDPNLVQNRVKGMTNTFVANSFFKSATPMSDASVTKVGFANVTSKNFGTKSEYIGGTIQAATGTGSSAIFTVTISKLGEKIFLGLPVSQRGKTISDVRIELDGMTDLTIFNANGAYAVDSTYTILDEGGINIYPGGVIIGGGLGSGGLSVGTHTIGLYPLTNDSCFIDYYAVIAAPEDCKPVVFVGAHHFDPDNIMAALGMRPYYNQYTDYVNSAASDVIAEYFGDYPISFVNPVKYFLPLIHLRGRIDPFHPNPLGGKIVAKEVLEGVRIKAVDRVEFRYPQDAIARGFVQSPGVVYSTGNNVIKTENGFGYNESTDLLTVPKVFVSTPGTLSDQESAFKVTAVQAGTTSGLQYGAKFDFTAQGVSFHHRIGADFWIHGNYTGTQMTQAVSAVNTTTGNANDAFTGAGNPTIYANYSYGGFTYGTPQVSGTNVGLGIGAMNADFNYGVLSRTVVNTPIAGRINVAGAFDSYNGNGNSISIYATAGNPTDPAVSGIAVFDNYTTTYHPIRVYDNGVEIFRVQDNGGTVMKEMATPSVPSATYGIIYPKSDGKLYYLSATAGTEVDLTAGAGGSGTVTDVIFTDGNGFDGTVTLSTSTPTIALTTTVTNKAIMYSNSGALGASMATQETDQILISGNATAGTSPFVVNGHEDLTAAITQFQRSGTMAARVTALGGITLSEQAAPSTPGAGYFEIYPKTDGKLYGKNDAGTEYDLTSGGGGSSSGSAGYIQYSDGSGGFSAEASLQWRATGNELRVGAGSTFTTDDAYAAQFSAETGENGIAINSDNSTYPLVLGRGGYSSMLLFYNNAGNGQHEITGYNEGLSIIGNNHLVLSANNNVIYFSNNNTTGGNYASWDGSGGNLRVGGTSSPTSATATITLFNGTAPSASVTNGVTIFAEDVAGSSELKGRDEAGNVTTLTPHNRTGLGYKPKYWWDWTYHSERDGKYVTVDMAEAIRTIQRQDVRIAELEKIVFGRAKEKPKKLVTTGKLTKK